MKGKDTNTEATILKAAKKVFVQKGMAGARMQEIADEAGINKALLHYYFRSKDKLFDAVFNDAFYKLVPNIKYLVESKTPLFEKIEQFVGNYIDVIKQNPLIPIFIMYELSREPDKIASMIKSSGVNPASFASQINEEIENGTINPVNPLHLIVNMLSLCIFPFVARPILNNVIFNNVSQEYDEFIEQRKIEVPKFIINSIKKK